MTNLLVAGLLLGRMGERGAPLVNVCQCINECVMKIINAAVWSVCTDTHSVFIVHLKFQYTQVWSALYKACEDCGEHSSRTHRVLMG